LYWDVARKYGIEDCLRKNVGWIIQGEQGDRKVQGNKYRLDAPRLWVFNIIDSKGYQLNYHEMVGFCNKWGLTPVPLIVDGVQLDEISKTIEGWVDFSKGKSRINPEIPREGIVIRSIVKGKKIFSFKVINPDFLLKFDN
jgi:hypothetical protein